MATVISNERLKTHKIDKYNFKVLAVGSKKQEQHHPSTEEKNSELEEFTEENNPRRRTTDIDSSAMSQSSKDSLIESLLHKTDEMSSNFIKLQMKLEEKEEEYKAELQRAKTEAFNEGVEAGKVQALQENESNYQNAIKQLSASVVTLEESAKEYEKALEGIKNELVVAALDIAQEVVSKEVSESSSEVAKILGNELIKELQSASKITLKVNPQDHGALSQEIGSLEHVEVVSDTAVSPGGVIAMSDAGNIDAQISKRFERVKRAALSE